VHQHAIHVGQPAFDFSAFTHVSRLPAGLVRLVE
jgi:hypothetical protein